LIHYIDLAYQIQWAISPESPVINRLLFTQLTQGHCAIW